MGRVTTGHPAHAHAPGMDRMTSTAPVSVTRIARALTYLVYTFVIVALIILLLGFVLKLFGANPDAPFAEWVYRGMRRVMAPFRGLFEPVALDGRAVLDVSILFAMLVYGIVALALHAFIEWLTGLIVAMRVDNAAARGRASTP
jgi:uncharacterized protein YggT (Ycf19 family)